MLTDRFRSHQRVSARTAGERSSAMARAHTISRENCICAYMYGLAITASLWAALSLASTLF